MATFAISGTPAAKASITVTVTDAAIVAEGTYRLQWKSPKSTEVAMDSAPTVSAGSFVAEIHFTGAIATLTPGRLAQGRLFAWDLSDPNENVLLGVEACPVRSDTPEPDDGVVTTPGEVAATQEWVTQQLTGGGLGKPSTAKSTPVDADGVTTWDSAALWVGKFTSWANAWTNYLKGKADALYAPVAHVGSAATGAHIGLGTAAAANTGDFATAAQGTDERVPTAAGLAAKLDASAAETTPADAWKLPVIVSAALKHITYANLVTTLKLILFGISVGETLPTTGNSNYRLCVLTAQDATAKAGQGLYWYDGTAWACLFCTTPYAWGNLGATPTTALIAGCRYVFTRDQIVTGWTLTLSRAGDCPWTLSGAFATVDPTCTGRTFKQRTATGYDDITAALVEGLFSDDGTYMSCSAVELSA